MNRTQDKTDFINRTQLLFRRIAIVFAVLFSLLVLYYCLLPALAENTGGSVYVYFDNALSDYDAVYYSTDGTTFSAMEPLSDVPEKNPENMTNVNPVNLYVTPNSVTVGTTLYFRGIASGTVYDTVSNFRPSSATREWGYDYRNFIWTTEAVTVSDALNCYYAPPRLMMYRYAGVASLTENGDKQLVQFIYAHGEKDADGTMIAKPELTGQSLFEPNTAQNRTYWGAAYEMGGYLGFINHKNTLGDQSQAADSEGSFATGDGDKNTGDAKVYHAYADFFDYYSDWELAGNQLADHTVAYASRYSVDWGNIIASKKMSQAPQTVLSFDYSEASEADNVEIVRNNKKDGTEDIESCVEWSGSMTHTSDGTGSLYVYKKSHNSYALMTPDGLLQGSEYTMTFWARTAREGMESTIEVFLEYTDANGQQQVSDALCSVALNQTAGVAWTEISVSGITYPEDTSNLKIRIHNRKNEHFYVDDVTVARLSPIASGSLELTASQCSPDTIYGIQADLLPLGDDQIRTHINYYNSEGDLIHSQVLRDLAVQAHTATKIENAYFSWLEDAATATIHFSSMHGSAFLMEDASVLSKAGYFDPIGSFSDSTNRISYVYQGSHWNEAISAYYRGSSARPLYFGSSSWFTGNGRYNLVDENRNPLFTQAEVDAGNMFVKTVNGQGVYLYPLQRQYLATLFGFNTVYNQTVSEMNTALGYSNSRGVAGLVDLTDGVIRLKHSDQALPYFDEAFLEGDNAANAVYGKVYNDVAFDFKYNPDTHYYEYDSTDYQYAARVTQNTADGSYYMRYTGSGVTKADASEEDRKGSSQTENQFYPFNSSAANDSYAKENLMFGMHLRIPFNMFKDEERRNDSIFKFSGDDDVWVYVDDQMVLDLGGTHAAIGGVVDLKNGYSVTSSAYAADTGAANSDWTLHTSGTAAGVTNIEKAAFAILASAKYTTSDGNTAEVGIDPEMQGEAFTLTQADFFGDSFLPADSTQPIRYSYQIDEANSVIRIAFGNIKDQKGNVIAAADATEYAVLRLSAFTLADDGLGGDLQQHELEIYYMERGLNSSNFKLAFNFIENTEREIEKEWADGAKNHTADGDSVTVDLYRTEPTVLEDQVFTFPAGYSVVRTVAYKEDGSKLQKTAFVRASDTVKTQFRFANGYDDTKNGVSFENSVFVLYVNGTPLNKVMYEYLANSSMQLQIYINDVLITGDQFRLGTGTLYYENGEVKTGGGTVIQDDGDKIYIQLPYHSENPLEQNRSVVRVVCKPRQFSATPVDTNSTWQMKRANGYLFEAIAYNADTGDAVPAAELKIVSHAQTTLTAPATDTTPARELNANDMRFAIMISPNVADVDNDGYYDDYDYRHFVYVLPKEDVLRIDYGLDTGSARSLDIYWSNHATPSVPYHSGTFGNGVNLIIENGNIPEDEKTEAGVIYMTDSEDSVIRLVCKNAKNNRHYCMDSSSASASQLYLYDTIGYTGAQFISTVDLNHQNSWKHTWANIIEAVTVEGELKEYHYFIRESKINGAAAEHEPYHTEYLDADGNAIQPTYIPDESDPDGALLRLYSIDNTARYLKIVNVQTIPVRLIKHWSESAVEQDVVLDLYSSYDGVNGQYVQSVQLTAEDLTQENVWAQTISGLPLYQKDTSDIWRRLTYYVAEQPMTYTDGGVQKSYLVSYAPSESETLQLADGSTAVVYLLNMHMSEPTITVTNRANNTGEFILQIYKSSVLDGNPALAGAKFRLEKLEDGNYTVIRSGTQDYFITDENGVIDFGPLLVGVNGTGSSQYRLTEVQAPLGFSAGENPVVEFTVSANADKAISFDPATLYAADHAFYLGYVWDEDADALRLNIRNDTQPIIMPATGGRGILQYIGGAVLLLLLTAAGRQLWKKRDL